MLVFASLEEGQTRDEVKLAWEPVEFTEQELVIQLNFDNPQFISTGVEENDIIVKILDENLFVRKSDSVPVIA